MTPVEIAIFASVFFVIVMLVFVVMFFTTAGLGKRKEREFSFASAEKLFELYTSVSVDPPEALAVPSANVATEQIRQAMTDGALLRARVLAALVGELRQEPDFCPRELAQVFLPSFHQFKKPIDADFFFNAVAHPSIHTPLTPLLAVIANPLLFSICSPLEAHDLGPEHAAVRKRTMEPVLGMVYHMSRLLLSFEPDVYYLHEDADLLHAHTRQTERWLPSLVVGKRFIQRPFEEQRVLLARKLALFRPELRILTVIPDESGFICQVSDWIQRIQSERDDAIIGWMRVPENDRRMCVEIAKTLTISEDTLQIWRRGAILSCFRLALLLTGQWSPIRAVLAEENDPAIRVDLMAFMARESFCDSILQLRT